VLLLPPLPGIALTDEPVAERILIYDGVVEITAAASRSSEITGISGLDAVSLSIRYQVNESITMNPSTLIPVNCHIFVHIISIATPEQALGDLVGNLTGWSKELDLQGNDCVNPPLLLDVDNGEPIVKNVNRDGSVVGIVRLDVDTVHVIGGNPFPSLNQSTYTSFWSLYYEPITGIIVHYTYTYSEREPVEGALLYSATLTLSNYWKVFTGLIQREVASIRLGNTTIDASAVVIYPVLYTTRPSILVGNSTIHIEFSNATYCFIVVGPFDPSINISPSIQLSKYVTIDNLVVYYTRHPIPCSKLQLNLSSPIESSNETLSSEKGVPPRYSPPGLDSVVFALLFVSIVVYALYSLINGLVEKYYGLIHGP